LRNNKKKMIFSLKWKAALLVREAQAAQHAAPA
jgi:hypothetical protein